MYLIVGLGNPEPEYSKTRHNMGFDVINKLSKEFDIEVKKEKYKALYGTGVIENEKVILLKPQTYMNLSGEAIKPFADFYKIDIDKIIVIYDDIDVETGTIKIRKKGGAGSHNGMKSVVYELGSKEFPRIKVGTGTKEEIPNLINYVIDKVGNEEYERLEKWVELAAEAVKLCLKIGIDNAMNTLN